MKKIILKLVLMAALAAPLFLFETNSYFTSQNTLASSNVSSGCWSVPTTPLLASPANNTVAGLNSAWNLHPLMDWDDSAATCPLSTSIRYQYESYRDAGLTQLAYRSGWLTTSQIPAPGTPEGNYWWHVRACDSFDHCSPYSTAWKLTVDRTAPSIPANLHWRKTDGTTISCGGSTNSFSIIADWNDSADPAPGQIDKYEYNIVYPKLDGTMGNWTAFVTSSQYNGSFNAGEGIHTYKVRTHDKAGNVSAWSDTCTMNYDKSAPATPTLSIEGSYVKKVEEKVENGGFEDGLHSWTTAGDVATTSGDTIPQPTPDPDLVITPYEGSSMARVGNWTYPGDAGNMVWENRLMQSIPSGAKSISLRYNFASYDNASDTPGFFIRMNGNEVFEKSAEDLDGFPDGHAYSSGWQEFNYDLSDYYEGDNINLALYGGNTTDEKRQSWVYVDAVTTYFVTAPSHAVYTITGTDAGSGVDHYEYRIDGGEWQRATDEGTFQLTTDGDRWIEYSSIDKAGNRSAIKRVRILTDATGPSAIEDFAVDTTGTNYAVLSWTAPGNDGDFGTAAKYDIRYSISPILDEDDFYSAEPASKSPVPQIAGSEETAEILGLNPGTHYYFAIKAADEAPNWSPASYAQGDTLPLKGGEVSNGDIIINELMWMGSGTSGADEWIELRNMTDREIDMTEFKIRKYNGSSYDTMVTLPVAKIAPRGYFLIANYAPGSEQSQLASTVKADVVDTAVDLADNHLQLELTDNNDNVLDSAWQYDLDLSSGEGEGLKDIAAGKYYSMERTSIPGDGTEPLSWYTCIDEPSRTEFFTSVTGIDVRGTPGKENRSENEPYSKRNTITLPSAPLEPAATIILSPDKKTVSFEVSNIEGFVMLDYSLSYTALGVEKGIAGTGVDVAGKAEYAKDGLDLATCSSNVCTWDESVYNFKLSVMLIDKDGNTKQVDAQL